MGKNRDSYQAFHKSVISTFGADRQSFVRGHKHAGIDIKGKNEEIVYPICAGRVVDIHLGFPDRTVVVEHSNADGTTFYSSYKHVEGLQVRVGDFVGINQPIARLFTEKERKKAIFQVTHLHFEIRKDISDEGMASWTSMTMAELEKYATDPLLEFKARLPAK